MVDPDWLHIKQVFTALCYGWSKIDHTSDRCLQHCAMVDLRLKTHQTGVYSTVLWLISDWPHIKQVFTVYTVLWLISDWLHIKQVFTALCYGWSQTDVTSNRCLQHCAMVDLRLTTHQTGVYNTVLWLIPNWRHIKQVFTALCYGWFQTDNTSDRCLQHCAMVDPDWSHIKQVFTALCYGWSQIDHTSNRCLQHCAMVDLRLKTHQTGVYSTVLWLISDWPHIKQVFTALCYGWSQIDYTSNRCLQHCAMVDPKLTSHQTGVYSTVLWLIPDRRHIRQVFTALCYGWSQIDHTSNRCLQHCAMVDPKTDVTSNRCLQHCAMVDSRLTTHQTGVYSTVLWLIQTDHTSNRCLQHCAMVGSIFKT